MTATGAQRVDRLVDRTQEVALGDPLDRGRQLGQGAGVLGNAMAGRIELLDGHPAMPLARVQRRVGMQDHLLARGAEGRVGGRADGHGEGAARSVVAAQRGSQQVIRHRCRVIGVAAREQDGELVAPDPEGAIGAPQVRPHDLGGGPQDLVAGHVAEAVVRLLEVVDVDHQQRQRRGIVARRGELVVERLLERAVIAQAGQAVEERIEPGAVVGVLQPGAVVLELADVAAHAPDDQDEDRAQDSGDRGHDGLDRRRGGGDARVGRAHGQRARHAPSPRR